MTKEELDKYFTTNYNVISKAIANIKWNTRPFSQWQLEEFITLVYQHLFDSLDELTQTNIESVYINFAKKNMRWNNSYINQLYAAKKLEYSDEIRIDLNDEDDVQEYEDKVNLEIEYQTQKAIATQFRSTLLPQEKILFDAIYIEGLKTIKALSTKFKINRYYLTNMRKDLNTKFAEYVQNQ